MESVSTPIITSKYIWGIEPPRPQKPSTSNYTLKIMLLIPIYNKLQQRFNVKDGPKNTIIRFFFASLHWNKRVTSVTLNSSPKSNSQRRQIRKTFEEGRPFLLYNLQYNIIIEP